MTNNDTNIMPDRRPYILHIADQARFGATTRYALRRAGLDGEYRLIDGLDAGQAVLDAIATRHEPRPELLIIDLHLTHWADDLLQILLERRELCCLPLMLISNRPLPMTTDRLLADLDAVFIPRPASLEEFAALLRPLADRLPQPPLAAADSGSQAPVDPL